MEKIDFVKEIKEAYSEKDLESVESLMKTLIEYQNEAVSSIKRYKTALDVERERHQELTKSLIAKIQGSKQDVTNLSAATSFILGLASASEDVSNIVKKITGDK